MMKHLLLVPALALAIAGGGAATAAAASTGTGTAATSAEPAWADCMAAHGVAAGSGFDRDTFDAAHRACARYLPDLPPPAPDPDEVRKVQDCLRDNGVTGPVTPGEQPDPTLVAALTKCAPVPPGPPPSGPPVPSDPPSPPSAPPLPSGPPSGPPPVPSDPPGPPPSDLPLPPSGPPAAPVPTPSPSG